mgnify:CR=1 FL=1
MWLNNFRIQYFLIHFILSVFVASCCLAITFWIWHPEPLAKAVGVTHIFFMMLAIDVIIGPVLTLIIAKQGKKSLKFDLMVICILQISALIYGMYNITISRPVWVAFDTMRFELVQANNISKELIKKAIAPYNNLSLYRPQFVAVKPAENDLEKSNRTFLELQTGISPSMQPTLYEPLSKQSNLIQRQSHSLGELYDFNKKSEVQIILDKYPQANAFVPLKANAVDMTVLIDAKGEVVKIVDLRPWR